ncbi:MAG: GNAT family N-acetyltransferase [Chitinivibrionales bacterium]|nr:GNAT family N-acetyltransferase [Chitinivibrionales bacterium]MBD3356782.1 GNAT family N-acetyltransferase [Chitinivibrionales bacterium]
MMQVSQSVPLVSIHPDLLEESVWEAIAKRFPNYDLEHTPHFISSERTRIRPEGKKILVGTVHLDGNYVGYLPLVYGMSDIHFSIGERRLLTLRVRSLTVLGKDILLESPTYLTPIIQQLSESKTDYDMILIKRLATESALWKHIHCDTYLTKQFFIYTPFGPARNHFIELPGTWDDYLAQLKPKVRHELRRKVRKMKNTYAQSIVVRRFTDESNCNEYLSSVRAVAAASWQRKRVGVRTIDNSDKATYECVTGFARKKLLRGYILYAKGYPVAYAFGLQYNGLYHIREIAYDQHCQTTAPGVVLCYYILKDLYEYQKPTVCDFGYGDARYKQELCNNSRVEKTTWLLKRKVSNHLWSTFHRATMMVQHAAGNVFSQLNIKEQALGSLRRK